MILMNLFEGRNGDRECTCGHSRGKSGTNRESSIDIYTLPCVKQIADEKLLFNTGSQAWCSVMMQTNGTGGRISTQEQRETNTK